MAVEAQHLNLFPSQLIGNRREMMSAIEGNVSNTYQNSTPIGCGLPPPVSGTTTDTMIPMMYGGCSAITDSVPPAMKADSGLTYALPVSVRKRSRVDSIDNPLLFPNSHIRNHINNNNNNNRCAGGGSFTFLGQDVSLQIQQQQLEIDRFIAQHTEKVRLEIEERRKRYSSGIITAVEEGIMKRLRAKEEEIEKIGKLNWALEERVKSLYVENQIWRDLAQTNEATANALRTNLEQLLVQQQQQQVKNNDNNCSNALNCDDAQSCCGSNYDNDEEEERRSLTVDCGGERKVVKDNKKISVEDDDCTVAGGSSRMMMRRRRRRLCRHCGKEESCVLLLPCRHLCLCTVCGSSVHCCPICNTPKNASLRVIISSS